MNNNKLKKVAVIGAGPAGLMAAEVLATHPHCEIHVYEQKPSAARKFLMAGKTGLNISHAEPFDQFIARYDKAEWLSPWIQKWDAVWIQTWMKSLGIESYVGSSGRIFPNEMKAAPLLRAWLRRLESSGVKFHYRHQVMQMTENRLGILDLKNQQQFHAEYDAVVLACGAVSWAQLGSDGAWQKWLPENEIQEFQASNAGVLKTWSKFMQPIFGQPLKRVTAWVDPAFKSKGDIVITHYGLESGLIYKHGRELRLLKKSQLPMTLFLDLLPEWSEQEISAKLGLETKQSLNNVWRKIGLDAAKSNLLRELVPKPMWNDPIKISNLIKHLPIEIEGFRPIEEAISCAGGIRQNALTEDLQLKTQANVFCCGEMLDWDAPTGGYLLTACFATGRAAGEGVLKVLLGSTANS